MMQTISLSVDGRSILYFIKFITVSSKNMLGAELVKLNYSCASMGPAMEQGCILALCSVFLG